jgi:hypothetical protein
MRLGAYALTRPRTYSTVVVYGSTYYYSGGVYYVQSGSGYTVVAAPTSAVVYSVPASTTVVYSGDTSYYYYGGTYYSETDAEATEPVENTEDVPADDAEEDAELPPMMESDTNYEVVAPPAGATVPYMPEEATRETVNDDVYYLYEGTYYRPFASGDETIYMVVEDPNGQSE